MPALPKPNESNFTPCPAGAHPAACYRVIDLGTQDGSYMGKPNRKHKLLISWEVFSEERMQDGRPFTISKNYTWSTGEKASLRKDLEMWRGAPFSEKDFGEGGFQIQNVIGKPCLLTVMHDEKDGKTYANVKGVTKMPKGMVVGAPENQTTFLWLSHEEFDLKAFEQLSDHIKETIKKSPEYQAVIQGKPLPEGEYHQGVDPDDEIPF